MSKNDSGNKVYTILAFVFSGEKRAHEVASEVKWDTRAAADAMGMKIISRAVVAVDARGMPAAAGQSADEARSGGARCMEGYIEAQGFRIVCLCAAKE